MNYMNEVRKMLNIEFNKAFELNEDDSKRYVLDETGLYSEFGLNSKPDILYMLLTGAVTIKREVLDDVEKEYLKAVTKPFRKRVMYIVKRSTQTNSEYISIHLNTFDGIVLPNFDKNKMYKGLIVDKRYSLKELNLE